MHHARSGRAFLPCPTPFDPFRSPVPAWISCSRATAFRTEAGRSRAPRAGRGRGSGASNTAAAADRRLVLEEGDSMPFRTARIDLEYRRERLLQLGLEERVARRPRPQAVALVGRGRCGGTQGSWPGQGSGVGPGRTDAILRRGAGANAPSAPSFALSAKKGP